MAYRSLRLEKGKWVTDPTKAAKRPPDGIANAESGRLQEVNIQLLEEVISPNFPGGSNIPSGSRNPTPHERDQYDPNQNRSPIQTLSEDRLHVSLRLGPILPAPEDDMPSLIRSKSSKPPNSSTARTQSEKKRTLRSSTQGAQGIND
ncbi:unnamed protein product [Eruca vesicaria subsp. sativa]|uniref:Uncharacterized protein n=1 Tax=Eruca vesicaria subsp. sativa TaxID=29727 RepID=A0ABC8K3Z2_ERUVS|nr:unnamed protein product [Eruca vesicaria subsp. sativa]